VELKKPTIILDLDETLIDTKEIKRRIFNLVEKTGVPRGVAVGVYRQMRKKSAFDQRRYCFELKKTGYKVNPNLFNNLFSKPKDYNYRGAEQFLKNLSKHFNLLLLTFGVPSFQNKKIEQAGFKQFFQKVLITEQESKLDLLRTLKSGTGKIILIDNSKVSIYTAKRLNAPAILVKNRKSGVPDYRAILTKLKEV